MFQSVVVGVVEVIGRVVVGVVEIIGRVVVGVIGRVIWRWGRVCCILDIIVIVVGEVILSFGIFVFRAGEALFLEFHEFVKDEGVDFEESGDAGFVFF